jgi:hypothetical protein
LTVQIWMFCPLASAHNDLQLRELRGLVIRRPVRYA